MNEMRDTDYAELLAETRVTWRSGSEARFERLRIKATNREEVRLSWWKEGRFIPRPVDMSEDDFWTLVRRGIAAGVLRGESGGDQ